MPNDGSSELARPDASTTAPPQHGKARAFTEWTPANSETLWNSRFSCDLSAKQKEEAIASQWKQYWEGSARGARSKAKKAIKRMGEGMEPDQHAKWIEIVAEVCRKKPPSDALLWAAEAGLEGTRASLGTSQHRSPPQR